MGRLRPGPAGSCPQSPGWVATRGHPNRLLPAIPAKPPSIDRRRGGRNRFEARAPAARPPARAKSTPRLEPPPTSSTAEDESAALAASLVPAACRGFSTPDRMQDLPGRVFSRGSSAGVSAASRARQADGAAPRAAIAASLSSPARPLSPETAPKLSGQALAARWVSGHNTPPPPPSCPRSDPGAHWPPVTACPRTVLRLAQPAMGRRVEPGPGNDAGLGEPRRPQISGQAPHTRSDLGRFSRHSHHPHARSPSCGRPPVRCRRRRSRPRPAGGCRSGSRRCRWPGQGGCRAAADRSA